MKTSTAILCVVVLAACGREPGGQEAARGGEMEFTGAPGEVKLMTLDPGHFHAALVQKTMYDQVAPEVFVFAPDGPDVDDDPRECRVLRLLRENICRNRHVPRVIGSNRVVPTDPRASGLP